jgi:hypothetical protein
MILTTMVRPYQAAGAQVREFADLGTGRARHLRNPRGTPLRWLSSANAC